MALRLYAILPGEGHRPAADDLVSIVAFRELAAVVEDAPYEIPAAADEDVTRHAHVIERLAATATVIPAPVGVVFRDKDVLMRWMELHYVALRDALAWVEDRVVARVHARRGEGPGDPESGTDLAAAAAEVFRSLRRRAVAAIPLKHEHLTGIVLSSAFLVERELWKEFAGAVEKAREETDEDLDVELTGPWPPYDFVQMQFGG